MMSNNHEMISRLREAAGYQKKAVRVLFPERMGAHFDVIENEIKMIFMETLADMMKECGEAVFCNMAGNMMQNEDGVVNEKKSKNTSSKKVDIL